MKKEMKRAVSAAALAVLFAVPGVVSAAVFNDDPADFPTLRVKNTYGQVNNQGWGVSATASPGDTVSFAIYYHNTGSDTASNVRVRLSPRDTSESSTHSFTAYVWADNAPEVSGSVTVNLTSPAAMGFESGSVVWRPNQTISGSQTLPSGQTGEEIFSSSGLLLGDIAPGWSAQGSVVLNFKVSGGNTLPSVQTYSASLTPGGTAAVLNGYVNPNGTADTVRWFEWGTSPSSLSNTTPKIAHTSAGNINATITGLSSGVTYYYRAVARNGAGTVYGGVLSFVAGQDNAGAPEAVTNIATLVGKTSARINGIGNNLGNISSYGWFEWGSTAALGNTTSKISLGAVSSNTFYQTLLGLSPGKTYYYRAVVENARGISRGAIFSFRTDSDVVVPPEEPKKRDARIEKTLENLTKKNGTETRVSARRGDTVRYRIVVSNTGDFTLSDARIKDRIPEYVEFANAREQNITGEQREVVWFIDSLAPGQSREVFLDVVVVEDAPLGAEIENTARFETGSLVRNTNTVFIDVVSGISDGVAGVFFAGSFLPDTLAGWILLALLILLLLILIRMAVRTFAAKKEG